MSLDLRRCFSGPSQAGLSAPLWLRKDSQVTVG